MHNYRLQTPLLLLRGIEGEAEETSKYDILTEGGGLLGEGGLQKFYTVTSPNLDKEKYKEITILRMSCVDGPRALQRRNA